MDPKIEAIVDAAFDVAVFSKTNSWPAEGSPEFFAFADKLDRLATALNAAYPGFNRNVRKDAQLTRLIDCAVGIANTPRRG